MEKILKIYKKPIDEKKVKENIIKIKNTLKDNFNSDTLKNIFGLIDLTSLNTTDGSQKGQYLCEKVNNFEKEYQGFPNVAAICVYPTLVKTIKDNLKIDSVKIASVTAGFPSAQTYLAIKVVESRMAVDFGADEIDIVMPVGKFLEKEYRDVFVEISVNKEAVGEVHVKTILETGALPTLDDVRLASIIAMEARSDFIKTSTGKMEPAATPEAFYVMCDAIRDFYQNTGKKIGIKPAGGISTAHDALLYYSIVDNVLGKDWLNPELFRIGASRLANNLLTEIQRLENGTDKTVSYF
ncbi:MAG: deoxyribose-phosphate aldolase [Marinilabiliales bacterium]